jgi:transcriptional regulator with XRE-family HTH domain
MLHNNKVKTSSERLAEIARRIEESELYDLEGAKYDISEQIHLVMEHQDVSKAKLARKLGKSRAYITKILQGNANFTLESLVKIARALDCKLDMSNVLTSVQQKLEPFDWLLLEQGKVTRAAKKLSSLERKYFRPVHEAPTADKENSDAPFVSAA